MPIYDPLETSDLSVLLGVVSTSAQTASKCADVCALKVVGEHAPHQALVFLLLILQACMDLNMLVPLDVIRKRPDYQTFADLVEERSTRCSPKWAGMSCTQIGTALKTLRERAAGSGAQACPAVDAGAYTCSIMDAGGVAPSPTAGFGPRASGSGNASSPATNLSTSGNPSASGCYGRMGHSSSNSPTPTSPTSGPESNNGGNSNSGGNGNGNSNSDGNSNSNSILQSKKVKIPVFLSKDPTRAN